MFKKWMCLSVAAVMLFFASVPQGSATEANEEAENADNIAREYGLINNYSSMGGEDYVNVITRDGSIKQYKILGTAKKALMEMGRFDFFTYKVSDGNVIKYAVKELMDGADDEPENVKINRTQAAKVDMITTARVDKVDDKKITYKVGDQEYHYYTSSTTAYWNMTNLNTVTGVEEGDYVVLIDTDDDGSMIDDVIVVTDQDMVEELEYDMTSFLSQQFKTVQSLTAEMRNFTMKKGETLQVELTAEYTDGTRENVAELAAWVSNKSNVVAVKNGKFTAKKAGNAMITAKYQDEEYNIYVTVE
ncbi:hypothetical protein [Brevibacillus sp. SYSU BS000544]|uniref:hypothetical protein n=1 Tax=Brevibacillus sp. SYSU BS000544 TaxID=3416443 RepID=UPI003CE5A924